MISNKGRPIMMPTRRAALAVFATIVVALAAPALAADNAPQPFTEAAFDAAQKAGKPILIDTFATWCDICARQKPIIDKLLGEAEFKNLVTFRVDFDTQKDVMRKFNARLQSTLIALRGDKEVARSVGETQPEWIEDLMSKATEKSPAS
jgi:thioredoxin 1